GMNVPARELARALRADQPVFAAEVELVRAGRMQREPQVHEPHPVPLRQPAFESPAARLLLLLLADHELIHVLGVRGGGRRRRERDRKGEQEWSELTHVRPSPARWTWKTPRCH